MRISRAASDASEFPLAISICSTSAVAAMGDVMRDCLTERGIDSSDLRRDFVEVQIEVVRMDQIHAVRLLRIPKARDHHLHQADDAPCLLEPLVLFEFTDQLAKVRVERIGIEDPGVERLRRRRREAHLVSLAERFTVGPCDPLNLLIRPYALKQALAQDVVEFVAVRIDGRDWDSDPSRLLK